MTQPEVLTTDRDAAALYGAAAEREERPRRRWRIGVGLAAAWLVLLVAAAVFADILPLPDGIRSNPSLARTPPSWSNLLGADPLGRDMLARVLLGARVSLFVSATATAVAGLVGLALGMLSGYFRRWTESVIMGAADILLAFPALVLALALTSFLGATVRNVTIAITILALPSFARVVRAHTLSLANRDFVRAARAMGATHARILLREVAPNVLPTLLAYGLVIIAIAVVVEGSLSFLGLGVPPPTPSWGSMIAAGKSDLAQAPHISMVPAAFMFVTVLSLNIVAEYLQERFAGDAR